MWEDGLYPLKEEQPYPFRQWWMAAYGDEIGRELLPRTILGKPMIFYRRLDGMPVALGGICPHRMFPLAEGRLIGDEVRCGYHGFVYDHSGTCTHVPSQPDRPARAAVPSYPLVERNGLVWVWTGEPELADEGLVPDTSSLGIGQDDWTCLPAPIYTIRGRYPLLIDNLLDLTHIAFIHERSIPNGAAVATAPYEIIATDESLLMQRRGEVPPNPQTGAFFPGQKGPTLGSFDAEYFSPALIRTGGRIWDKETERYLGTTNFNHLITPETPHSTHYWVISTMDFKLDPAIVEVMMGSDDQIRPEDAAAIEAIEKILQTGDVPKEISCFADNGALQVRRRLEAQILTEQSFPVMGKIATMI